MNINDIVRLWYKTQHGHIEKCRKAQSEFDNIMWDLCEKLDNGKTREVYWIEKSRCRTIEEQFDWILHMNEKNWINGYEFKDEFAAAIRLWAHEDTSFATAIRLKAK